MLEIAERADVAAGTVYNYFKSKDDLALAVLEDLMYYLALRIEQITDTFEDPAQVYAYDGIRSVIDTATEDVRWRELLHRSEVIATAMVRLLCMPGTGRSEAIELANRERPPLPSS